MPKVVGRKVKIRDISAPSRTERPGNTEQDKPKKSHKLLYSCFLLLIIVILALVGLGIWMNSVAARNLSGAEQNFTDHYFTEAKREYEFAAALSFFRSERAAKAYEGIGDIFSYKQSHEEAAESYRKSLTKHESDDVRVKYAGELFELHNYADAQDQLEAIDVPDDETKLFLAKVLLMRDNFSEAQALFQELAASGTDEADYYLALFDLRDQDESALDEFDAVDQEEFAKHVREALDRDAFSAFDYVRLGSDLLDRAEPAFALDFAREALKLEEDYRDAFSLAARAYLARGQYVEAQEELEKALTISPLDASLWSIQAAILEGQESVDEAKSAYAKAEELGADSLGFHYDYGLFARSVNDFEKASIEFEKVVTLDTEGNNNFFDFYFWSVVDSGNLDKASELAENERADRLFGTFVQYKLQKINDDEVLEKTEEVSGYSALDQYLTGLATSNEAEAKVFLTRAIDFDEDGLVAPRAREALAVLESK